MNLHFFTHTQNYLLLVTYALLGLSIIAFHIQKQKLSIWLLASSSLSIGLFIANLDPFLILWDEQYHALVAKNLLLHPLKPTLYETPLLNYDFKYWTDNHIWLHKQPLFLWQMAMSLKLFGINTLAVRIPSVIMHMFTTIMIYRIGKISVNEKAGFYGAIFFAFTNHFLELVAGKLATDHNDVAFLCYVTSSFWAWFEYQHTKRNYWIVLIGLFAGCAVLTKWLVGMLVYLPWLATIGISNHTLWFHIKSYKHFFVSLLTCAIVFIPWQWYILHTYPREAAYEFKLNAEHFFKVVENQGGDVFFHFNALKNIYGTAAFMPLVLIISCVVIVKYSVNIIYRSAIVVSIVFTYLFYTLAATKMISFCIIVSPFVFIGMGATVDVCLNYFEGRIKIKRLDILARSLVLLLICFSFMNLDSITKQHTMRKADNTNRNGELATMTMIHSLQQKLGNGKFAVFNVGGRVNAHIAVMFYTSYVAYNFIPNASQIEKVKSKDYKLAVFYQDNLPNYIITDKSIVVIR